MLEEKRIKFVRRANMWVYSWWKNTRGRMKQGQKWFHTKDEAEAFANSNNEGDNSK